MPDNAAAVVFANEAIETTAMGAEQEVDLRRRQRWTRLFRGEEFGDFVAGPEGKVAEGRERLKGVSNELAFTIKR